VNFQNIPRTNKDVKRAFVPKLDAFLFFDYKQIEPRFLAYFMDSIGDDGLASKLRDGDDTYTAIISQYYGRADITEEERQLGKRLFLSLMYGGGTPTVIKQFGVDYPVAKRMTDQFHAAWPGIRRLQKMIDNVYETRGYIVTPWGRHLHPEFAHKRLNALMQGSAADLMRYALLQVHDYTMRNGMTSHIVSVIHDEIVVDAAMGEVFEITEQFPHLMDYSLVSDIVPILTDTEWSTTSWADKVNYEGINVV
jgi:DNA polymerase-1